MYRTLQKIGGIWSRRATDYQASYFETATSPCRHAAVVLLLLRIGTLNSVEFETLAVYTYWQGNNFTCMSALESYCDSSTSAALQVIATLITWREETFLLLVVLESLNSHPAPYTAADPRVA